MSHARRLRRIENLIRETLTCQACGGRGGGHVVVEWSDKWGEGPPDWSWAHRHPAPTGPQPCRRCGVVGPPRTRIIVELDEIEPPEWDGD